MASEHGPTRRMPAMISRATLKDKGLAFYYNRQYDEAMELATKILETKYVFGLGHVTRWSWFLEEQQITTKLRNVSLHIASVLGSIKSFTSLAVS